MPLVLPHISLGPSSFVQLPNSNLNSTVLPHQILRYCLTNSTVLPHRAMYVWRHQRLCVAASHIIEIFWMYKSLCWHFLFPDYLSISLKPTFVWSFKQITDVSSNLSSNFPCLRLKCMVTGSGHLYRIILFHPPSVGDPRHFRFGSGSGSPQIRTPDFRIRIWLLIRFQLLPSLILRMQKIFPLFPLFINCPTAYHLQSRSVFRIRIRIRIHVFFGIPDPDPLVRGMDPDPSIIMEK